MNPKERRYLNLVLLFVALNVIVASAITTIFVWYSQWKSLEDKNFLILEQTRHLAIVAIEGSIEDVYKRNLPAIELRLNAAVIQATKNIPNLKMCIDFQVIESEEASIGVGDCLEENLLEFDDQFTETEHQLMVGSKPIAKYRIKTVSIDSEKQLGGFLLATLILAIQIPIFAFINYYNLYGRLIKPLLADLKMQNEELKRYLKVREQERKIPDSMLRLSSALANAPIKDVEMIYLRELQNEDTFPDSVILTKNRIISRPSNQVCANALATCYSEIMSIYVPNSDIEVLDLEHPQSEYENSIARMVGNYASVDAYIVIFTMPITDQVYWIYIQKNRVAYSEETSFVKKYFTNLVRQFCDYRHFREYVTDETLTQYRELTKRDGYVPINEKTTYVEYQHPYSLVYDVKGKEQKVRISISRLRDLFPQHLVQVSQTFLINPKYAFEEDLDGKNGVIRIKWGNKKISRIKCTRTFAARIVQQLTEGKNYVY